MRNMEKNVKTTKKKEAQKTLKNARGITLIALVITIIVLLILAGVTIAALSGDNGILQNAGKAKEENRQASIEEKIKLLSTETIIDQYTGQNGEKTAEELQSELNNQGENVLVVQWDKYIIFDLDENREYRVTNDGSVEYWGESTMGTTLKNMTDIDTLLIGKNSDGERVIGVDYNGIQVNMNFWECTILENKTYALNDEDALTGSILTPGYIADEDNDNNIDILDGEIKGTIPQYIRIENDENWIAVTDLGQTFRYLTSLTVAPIIPNTVIKLKGTFCDTDVRNAPEIPYGVTDMNGTFGRCYNLEVAPNIPKTVIDMTSTFYQCSNLNKIGTIPDSVKQMSTTFLECENLTNFNIPKNVEKLYATFRGCKSLQNIDIIIPNSVTNIKEMFANCNKLSGEIYLNCNIVEKENYLYFLANANKSDSTTETLKIYCNKQVYNLYKSNVDFFGYSSSNMQLLEL